MANCQTWVTIAENIGKKVILVDFWTYSCINCQRTLPYLTTWHNKYKNKGLLIIGVHTPEFDFEKEYDNVVRATKKWDLHYPIILDNDHQTWRAYKNRYWPRKYLIDIDGFIVYDHIGEGSYAETEEKIQALLQERNQILGIKESIEENVSQINAETPQFGNIKTPEIYFGYEFQRGQMGNKEGWVPEKTMYYSPPEKQERNKFYLQGNWKNNPDNLESIGEQGSVFIQYDAKIVNIVAGSSETKEITFKLDHKTIGKINVSNFELYQLVAEENYAAHSLELEIPPGVMIYTLTFG